MESVAFASAINGWVVGSNGTILHTGNGGGNWSAQTSGTTNFLFGVDAVQPPVPEPAAAELAALGLFALLSLRSRRPKV